MHLTSIRTRTFDENNAIASSITETIDYDAIGNPISYRGATMGWYGRQMTSYSKDGISITNTYDVDGIRGSKTVNGSKTTYQYLDGKLHYEKRGDGRELYYYYDSYGNLSMIRMWQGTTKTVYYVSTNSQGDVIGLYNSDGTIAVEYEYDAWGNATIYKIVNGEHVDITGTEINHIGNLNAIRYRGYYYDVDMGLYYLQSRYYDASIGRFINADAYFSTGQDIDSYNMFAYCGNNPIVRTDASGEAWYHWVIGAAVVAACAVATIVTCGGFAAAAMAVTSVASGVAATTTASTIAAGAFIGSASVYSVAVMSAAGTSESIEEFNAQGNWGTVAFTAGGGIWGGYKGYNLSNSTMSKSNMPKNNSLHTSGYGSPKNNINPGGSYTKLDHNGKLYSYTQFDNWGRQTLRMDFQGRPHAGVLPHTHLYTYPMQGGRIEEVFDMKWNLIK